MESIGEGPRKSARRVAPIVLELTDARSVVDVGCGNGAWLEVFRELGVDDLFGIEGPGIDHSLVSVPPSQFLLHDLGEPLSLDRRFDLAVCLEVGEHLEAQSAPVLVESLTELAPVVLFSAAIPGQGGHHHVNEQWPDYWERLFSAHGYLAIDCIRATLWDDSDVDVWYRQNSFVFVDGVRLPSIPKLAAYPSHSIPRRVVHPDLVASWPPRIILRILGPAVRRSLARRISRLTGRFTARRPA